MEKRVHLRVQKKKAFKRGKKHLLKRVVDYLNSDSFMYAPLLSDYCSPHTIPSSAKVVELKKPMIPDKPFLEQVGDYMKSDVYMYAPVVGSSLSPQVAESLQSYRRIRMAVSTTRLTLKVNQLTDHSGNVNQISENHLPLTAPFDQPAQGHKETVKHTVYQTCHS
ncbi:uncharacterized protein G2W53_006575 [Senna tora]|uniref:Uncharacterized protein n=1 Tax=Senna tora TaxID=362788 RepID=A0A834X5Z7_9FABA|nr:uncharacterized protein G2W53_006575 [Senna tora]